MLEKLKQLPKLVTKRDSQEVIAEATAFGLSAKTDSTGSPESLFIICHEEQQLQSPITKRPRSAGKENVPIRTSLASEISMGDVWTSPVSKSPKDSKMTNMSTVVPSTPRTSIETHMPGTSPATKSPAQSSSPSKKRKWYVPLRICSG
jgi:hypothetical protein